MKINKNQINQIYLASTSENANFKNLNYKERRIVEMAIKAIEKNPAKPKAFTTIRNVNIENLVKTIKGTQQPKRSLSSIEKTFARIFGAKSSKKLATLAKDALNKKIPKSEVRGGNLDQGYYYEQQKDFDKADSFFSKEFKTVNQFANNSNGKPFEEGSALYLLGTWYSKGLGHVVVKDDQKAEEYFSKAYLRFQNFINENPSAKTIDTAKAHLLCGTLRRAGYPHAKGNFPSADTYFLETGKIYAELAENGNKEAAEFLKNFEMK